MKKTVFTLIVLMIFSNGFAQDMNQVIVDPNIKEEILYGNCDRQGLTSGQFNSWFEPEYQSYMVNDSIIFGINLDLLFSCNITVVMGTWCSDSQREVPRLYKILDYVNFPENNLTMICIDRRKNADRTVVQDLNIELVPTIIFFNGDEEIGRIVEAPEESLEADMVRIVGQ
jgi:hypothetical protein